MALKVTKADIWHGEIADEPGGLNRIMGALADAGANLDCVIARRQPDKPGTGVVFMTPLKGRKIATAAHNAGLEQAGNIATLRIDGPNKAGLGRKITQAIADAGVNMRGLSAAVIGNKFVAYLAFDHSQDAARVGRALRAIR